MLYINKFYCRYGINLNIKNTNNLNIFIKFKNLN